MHIYTLRPSLLQSFTKFFWAASEELCWQTVLVVSFIWSNFLVQKGRNSWKKIESKFPVDMHIYTLCLHYYRVSWNSVERFQRSWDDKLLNFGQISKFKKGVFPIKKMNQNFLRICISTHYVLHDYKVSQNSFEQLQRSCPDKLFWLVFFILVKFLSSKRA